MSTTERAREIAEQVAFHASGKCACVFTTECAEMQTQIVLAALAAPVVPEPPTED